MKSAFFSSAIVKAMPSVFVVIWSTGFIVAKYGLPFSPPLTFLAMRYFLSIVCFLIWIGVSRASWPQGRAQWLHLGVTGLLMHAGYLGGVWLAVKAGMGSGLAALIVGLQPVLTALWVAWAASENTDGSPGVQVTLRQWTGLALGFGGLLMVVSRKFGSGHEATLLTLACIVFALFSITAGTLYQKHFVKPADVRTANAIQLGAALLVTLPLTFFESEAIVWNHAFLSALGWSVLVLTLGGSSLLYLLIQRGAATAVTSLFYLVPPTTAIMAWALFDEHITAITILGTAVTAVGVSLVVRAAKTRPSTQTKPM